MFYHHLSKEFQSRHGGSNGTSLLHVTLMLPLIEIHQFRTWRGDSIQAVPPKKNETVERQSEAKYLEPLMCSTVLNLFHFFLVIKDL